MFNFLGNKGMSLGDLCQYWRLFSIILRTYLLYLYYIHMYLTYMYIYIFFN